MANKKKESKKAKANRDKLFKEASHDRFLKQREAMIKPTVSYICVVLAAFVLYVILDTPQKIFDSSSMLFTCMLLGICVVPMISLVIVKFATKTIHLLLTQTLHQLTIIPLIITYLLKYEELKEAVATHLMFIYLIYVIIFLAYTSVYFKLKSQYLSSNDSL